MDRDATFHDAKRLYLEQYGDPMVTNTYLKIALALLSIVCVALALIDLRTIRTFQNFRPLVIRIDDLGRAEAINHHNFEYKLSLRRETFSVELRSTWKWVSLRSRAYGALYLPRYRSSKSLCARPLGGFDTQQSIGRYP